MNRKTNTLACMGMGLASGLAFFGAEELIYWILGQPGLRPIEIAQLLPFYAGIPALAGLAVGLAGFQRIAAAMWVWGGFGAVLWAGPIAGWVDMPFVVGLGLASLVGFTAVIGLLYLSRERDSLRWGSLFGAWTITLFAAMVDIGFKSLALPLLIGLNIACLILGAAAAMAVTKALDGREPKFGAVAAIAAALFWIIRIALPDGSVVAMPGQPGKDAASTPNVVVILVDGLRNDGLGYLNGTEVQSPNLDALAARLIVYQNNQAPSSFGVASLASVLTGQLPSAHGVGVDRRKLSAGVQTFPEYLKDQGYINSAVVGRDEYVGSDGFDQGFDSYRLVAGVGHLTALVPTLDGLGVPILSTRDYATADRITKEAIHVLESRKRGPWMLMVQYSDLLGPFTAPEELLRGVGERAEYFAEIGFIDEHIGRLIDAVPPDAFIIVAGTHGKSFGEHPNPPGAPADATVGTGMYQEHLGAPLIMLRPRNIRRSTVVLRTTRTQDIMPTLLDIAGLVPRQSVDARPLVEGLGRNEPDQERSAVSEGVLWGPRQAAVRRGAWKLVVQGEDRELYNLVMDPDEKMDLAADNPLIAEDLYYDLPWVDRPANSTAIDAELKEHFDQVNSAMDDGRKGLTTMEDGAAP